MKRSIRNLKYIKKNCSTFNLSVFGFRYLFTQNETVRQELRDFLILLDKFEFAGFAIFNKSITMFDHLEIKDMYRKV